MVCAIPHHPLFLFLLLFLLPFSIVARTNGTVDVGTSITANNKDTPWLSPEGVFAFGFKPLEEKNLFLLSIWYHQIPDQTIVWYGYDGVPVSIGSKLDLTVDRGLVLSDPQGNELWKSLTILDNVAYGFMNDTGNFVLVRSDSVNLWESFKNPTDTMLPTQIMESGGVIFSRLSETNFSQGRFQFRLLQDGNLVLNTRDITTNFAYDAYYISGTYDPSNLSNSGYRVIFDDTGFMYILTRNNRRIDLTPRSMLFPATENFHRATLNFDGVFTQYYYPKTFDNGTKWTPIWSQPDNICVDIRGTEGSGACGFNSICKLNDYKRPDCKCPRGYSLLDPNNTYGSCKPNFAQGCLENDINSAEAIYDFETLIDTDWPTSDYEQLVPATETQCKRSCINDCFCAVAILRGDSCWKKKLPLSNGREDSVVNGKAFMKFRKSNLLLLQPPPRTLPSPPVPETKKNQGTLILVGSVLLGSSVFINFVLIGAVCLGFFLIYHKKSIESHHGNHSAVETNLRCFTYKELVEATNGFKEELGSGAFGIVYKGAIQMGSRVVAVKKLDRVVQEKEKEFKTEVNVIGQTHHKNLVRLLGFCDEGQHRMLVYEFMSNGTLASFLFGKTKPSWNQRTQIALGIARGLVYLHEECSTQIIHCDIKPQNILLDDCYNARISDFGLAKLLMLNQSKINTATIRGTKGYVAAEWFNSNPITAKVDVYSYGVLLLEIISCRKSVSDLEVGEEEKVILTDWACDCFQEGKLDTLVENDMEALNDWKRLERFLMVAIWCIQEDPSLRPTMRKVTQMLEGVVEVDVPPCPSQFSFTS
ncbi:G-type lectin S-receptor-like serine/threonine-protein kinase LECRK3 [Camellia sinensis]|uniref:Receptor-like serine/threonine-protein kinase n=1 Tax=Camellia sinensis var. sinensis TaxID=542762 RepID=A0A4S4EVL6_CAMSN|nr:G-type lectin S-receptor-like serine/threonine-protein kinase LECRK3 [Camellia sinensis]THG21009.1 hypothetical protein TEA_026623 [Camellia sinensis var. sinensis]